MTTKPSPAERAAQYAVRARSHADAAGSAKVASVPPAVAPGEPGPQPEHHLWHVYKPGIREPFEVTVYPAQTQRDMVKIVYPGCGCIPR